MAIGRNPAPRREDRGASSYSDGVTKKGDLMKRFVLTLLVMTLLTGAVLLASCAKPKPVAKKPVAKPEPSAEQPAVQNGKGGVPVLMMGRSVMSGWFSHWTKGSGATSVRKGKHTLRFVEISTPPDIAKSVEEKLVSEGDKPIVFFKFCFDDFAGSSRDEASASLAEKKKYVEQVYGSVVKKRGLTLIAGNALPKVKSATDTWLVWNHRQFNKWLSAFASDHEGEVIIFDEYGVLAGPDGSLKAAYASSPDDSHPNEAGYKALDGPFEKLLGGF